MITRLPNSKTEVAASADEAKQFRRLKSNELVRRGDFMADPHNGFQPWEGPTAFRADAFAIPIYRKHEHQPLGAKK